MKVEVTQENLSKALQSVGRVASTRSTLPILANVLLATEGNRLKIAATNLEIAVTHWIGSKVKAEGGITVPARLLSDFVSSLPPGNIQLAIEGNSLHILSGNYQSDINGIPSDEFPSLPTINVEKPLVLPAELVRETLAQVLPAVSSDDARPVLTGIYIYNDGNKLVWVATDSYRLAERVTPLKTTPPELNLLVPARSLSELVKLIDGDEEVLIYPDEGQVKFSYGDSEVISRLIDGKFPSYRQLIPETSEITAELPKDEFMSITKVASLFARESAGSVTLATDEVAQTLAISSIASQVGKNTSAASAKVKGEGKVTLNSRYIIDALNAIKPENVVFRFSGKLNPCVITPADGSSDYTHVIMPLRS